MHPSLARGGKPTWTNIAHVTVTLPPATIPLYIGACHIINSYLFSFLPLFFFFFFFSSTFFFLFSLLRHIAAHRRRLRFTPLQCFTFLHWFRLLLKHCICVWICFHKCVHTKRSDDIHFSEDRGVLLFAGIHDFSLPFLSLPSWSFCSIFFLSLTFQPLSLFLSLCLACIWINPYSSFFCLSFLSFFFLRHNCYFSCIAARFVFLLLSSLFPGFSFSLRIVPAVPLFLLRLLNFTSCLSHH